MGLSMELLIHWGGGGGGFMWVKIMASETTAATNTTRQNEDPYLKQRRKCNILFIYFLTEENLYLKSLLFGSKIRISTLIQEGLCMDGIISGVE